MLRARRDVLKEHLEKEAGLEPLQDRYHVGYIAAVNDLVNIHIEEIE
jgi:hypothetical protein